MQTLAYYLNFSAHPSLYAPTGLLAGSRQPDALRLGPFDHLIDITPNTLRHGHEGPPIATFEMGAWRLPFDRIPALAEWWGDAPPLGAARFTDVAITAEGVPDPPDETLGLYLELSTAHISEATDQQLAAHSYKGEVSNFGLPRYPEGWPAVVEFGYGHIVRVPADMHDTGTELTVPDDLRAILRRAAAKRGLVDPRSRRPHRPHPSHLPLVGAAMFSITEKQIETVARLQNLARQTYRLHDYPGSPGANSNVSIAALTDSEADSDSRGVLRTCGGPLANAIVVAITYVSSEWTAEDGPTRVPVIVLPDGTPIGAPFELTGEVTITAPFELGYLDDDIPAPTNSDFKGPLLQTLTDRLSVLAASEYQKHAKARPNIA